ncbi:MAG: YceI family protein [Gemmatimonadetes bacterium]|jgi:polyisoprenoid-binding protein YceI|nr:YceI family protein [Gemmatimonadota bacterium]
MRIHTRLSIRRILPVLALAMALPSLGWMSTSDPMSLRADSRIWVEGTSSMKSWSCAAGDVNATIDGSPTAVAQVAAGEKGVRTVRVNIPADKIDCHNGTMNEHMKKALKVSEFQSIDFKMTSYDVSRGADASAGTLKGTLTLGGVQKSISIAAQGRAEGGALHVTGSYDLSMKDYDLTPPSLMFGRIKVRDTVTVKFDLLLKS